MKIYFTAATTNNGDYLKQEKAIVAEIKKLGHSLTSGEQILDHKQLEKDAVQSAEEIFYREKQAIDVADCVIADLD